MKHGEDPECQGVVLPWDLRQEPTPYTSAHYAWMVELREFAASWDGGATPMPMIDHVEPATCPGCGLSVIIIHT